MKTGELQTLYQEHLHAWLPGYVRRKHLLFHFPVELLLKGFHFESAAFDRSFTIECFIQPLYIPREHLVFNIGRRLGGRSGRWFEFHQIQKPQGLEELCELLENQGLPFHRLIESPADLVTMLRSDTAPITVARQEAIAYLMCLDDLADHDEVRTAFNGLRKLLEPDMQTKWVQVMDVRATQLLGAINRSPKAARELLLDWAARTRGVLNLQEGENSRRQ